MVDYGSRLEKASKHKYGGLLLVLVSLFVLVILVQRRMNLRSQADSVGLDIYFSPEILTLDENSQSVYDVYTSSQNGARLAAGVVHLEYDNSLVEIVDVTLSTSTNVMIQKEIGLNNAQFTFGIHPDNVSDVTTKIATVVVRSKNQSGITNISFSDATELSIVGSQENALLSMADGQVAIGDVQPSPTPEPTVGSGEPTSTPVVEPTGIVSPTPTPRKSRLTPVLTPIIVR